MNPTSRTRQTLRLIGKKKIKENTDDESLHSPPRLKILKDTGIIC